MTDTNRILQLFRTSQGREISNTELVNGQFFGTKRIIEYSGRISDARNLVGCTCGKDKTLCSAREHIINIRKNYYVYKNNDYTQPVSQEENNKPEMPDLKSQLEEIKTKLNDETDDFKRKLLVRKQELLVSMLQDQEYLKPLF